MNQTPRGSNSRSTEEDIKACLMVASGGGHRKTGEDGYCSRVRTIRYGRRGEANPKRESVKEYLQVQVEADARGKRYKRVGRCTCCICSAPAPAPASASGAVSCSMYVSTRCSARYLPSTLPYVSMYQGSLTRANTRYL